MLIGWKYRYHMVIHSHNAFLEPIRSRFHRITHKLIENLCVLVCKSEKMVCLAVSDRAGSYLYKNGKYEILHAGIDVRKYRFDASVRDKIRNKYGLDNSRLYGFVGRLEAIKNPIFVIDIFKEIANLVVNANLMIVGSGSLMNEMKSKVHNEGLDNRVIFIGEVTNVADYLQAMDLIISPSISEGMPLLLMESQASGLPAVCSADRIPKEIRVTELVCFLSLEKSPLYWAKKCVDIEQRYRFDNRAFWNDVVYKTNFEIQNAAAMLKDRLI